MSDAKVDLRALRAQILRESKTVDVKLYSHNIINFALRQISTHFGDNEANQAITDFKLKRLGWSYKTCDHCGLRPCGCGG